MGSYMAAIEEYIQNILKPLNIIFWYIEAETREGDLIIFNHNHDQRSKLQPDKNNL